MNFRVVAVVWFINLRFTVLVVGRIWQWHVQLYTRYIARAVVLRVSYIVVQVEYSYVVSCHCVAAAAVDVRAVPAPRSFQGTWVFLLGTLGNPLKLWRATSIVVGMALVAKFSSVMSAAAGQQPEYPESSDGHWLGICCNSHHGLANRGNCSQFYWPKSWFEMKVRDTLVMFLLTWCQRLLFCLFHSKLCKTHRTCCYSDAAVRLARFWSQAPTGECLCLLYP